MGMPTTEPRGWRLESVRRQPFATAGGAQGVWTGARREAGGASGRDRLVRPDRPASPAHQLQIIGEVEGSPRLLVFGSTGESHQRYRRHGGLAVLLRPTRFDRHRRSRFRWGRECLDRLRTAFTDLYIRRDALLNRPVVRPLQLPAKPDTDGVQIHIDHTYRTTTLVFRIYRSPILLLAER